MTKPLVIVAAMLSLMQLGCRNENPVTPIGLNGKWVDVSTKSDTLTFGSFGGQESMILGRGKEMRSGALLPKEGSGPYEYKLLTDSISLRWTLSSNSSFYRYYFKQTGDQLVIGKFFELTTKEEVLTLKRID